MSACQAACQHILDHIGLKIDLLSRFSLTQEEHPISRNRVRIKCVWKNISSHDYPPLKFYEGTVIYSVIAIDVVSAAVVVMSRV